MNELILGLLLVTVSTLFYSLNHVFNKKNTLNLSSNGALTYNYFFLLMFVLIFSLFFESSFKINSITETWILLFTGIIGYIGILALFKSFSHMPIAIAVTIANIFPFITLILGVIVFDEVLPISILIIMFIMFFGILLVRKNKIKKIEFRIILLPLLCALCWAIYYIMIAYLMRIYSYDVFSVSFYTEGIIFLIALGFTAFYNKSELIFIKRIKEMKIGFVGGLFTALGSLLVFSSYKYLPIAVSSSIATSNVMLTAIWGYLFFNEKLSKVQIIGIFIVMISVILFYLFI